VPHAVTQGFAKEWPRRDCDAACHMTGYYFTYSNTSLSHDRLLLYTLELERHYFE
jgi:hypothetical protein